MSKVYFDLTMSLDGFIAAPNVSETNPLGDEGEQLHDWMFADKTGDEARRFQEEMFSGTGAVLMGRTMFDWGVGPWGENPVFHVPVFVVTHRAHEPVAKEGGTTYYFVTSGPESALEQARSAAAEKEIRIEGGADIVVQYLNAGQVDEMRLHVAPVFLGGGVGLFDGIDRDRVNVQVVEAVHSPYATYIRYEVKPA